MITLTLIEKIFICFLCVFIGFGFANIIYQPPKYDFIQPVNSTDKNNVFLSVEQSSNKNTELKKINSAFKLSSKEIDNYFYDKIIPIKEKEIDNMKCYNVHLGENSNIKDALGWLHYHFPNKNFKSNFSYALYNNNSLNNEIDFQYRIKEPPPKDFLLAYFDGGTRDGKNNLYNLDTLTQMGNGASDLYFFWSNNRPYIPESTSFTPENYHLEIIYDKGTNYGGPSYLAIDKIIIKDIQKDKIVAVYPINQKIEEPFYIHNYDFVLKFPFYNYIQEGMLWSNSHIKSLKKIDLYEKRSGQNRTLYYDVE
ncbi:hypothetical protein [Paulownia witches'-broom phytoplasma]|uniref:hypothetical protein n=1 Tax=Paulownia witches'-broom phytoplasma TaxID=39647 RepID=UPI002D1F2E5B|nr:hypothetical protein PAWBP_5600 [Paulownia witches'-broom phytoplasma]